MSRTYDIVCHDCKVSLWIGQGHSVGRKYIYGGDEYFVALENFLFGHMNHKLEFGDDEGLGDDYKHLDDDFDPDNPERKLQKFSYHISFIGTPENNRVITGYSFYTSPVPINTREEIEKLHTWIEESSKFPKNSVTIYHKELLEKKRERK